MVKKVDGDSGNGGEQLFRESCFVGGQNYLCQSVMLY